MNELRWILLAAGLVLIAGVYLWGTRSRQRSAAAPVERAARFDPSQPVVTPPPAPAGEPMRMEPSLSADESLPSAADSDEPFVEREEVAPPRPAIAARREPTLGPHVEPMQRPKPMTASPPQPERELEAATPPQRQRQRIVAVRVVATAPVRFEGGRLQEAILAEGLQFGRYDIFHRRHVDGRPIFSLASLREPGTFDPETMPGTSYPGIALFGVLPGPLPASEAFDQLIFTARSLAAQLNGTLADDRGAPLTVHRITRLREEMLAFDQQRPGSAAD